MKFEIEFGYFGNNKLTVETHDFDMIEIFQKFVEFQENYGWAVEYAAVEDIADEFEEIDEEDLEGTEEYAAAEAANKE